MATFPRQLHEQQIHYLAKRVTYSDSGISSGVEFGASLPANAFIVGSWVKLNTAFAATTTNVLTVGSVQTTANNIITGGDINETTTNFASVAGVGVLSKTAETKVYVMFTGAGTANTAGEADIVIGFIPLNNP